MKCLLHIGTEKTGTTTIQDFLRLNRELLDAHGVVVPRTVGEGEHLLLPLMCYQPDREDELLRRLRVDRAGLPDFQRRRAALLRRELTERLARSPATVLFSSEHLQSRLTLPEERRRLREVLASCGLHDVRILVYIRDPAAMLCSLASTAVKAGATDPRPFRPDGPEAAVVCDYRRLFEDWASVFGEENICVRLFDPQTFASGDLLRDFAAAAGLPPDLPYSLPRSANRALSAAGAEIAARFNRRIPVFVNGRPNPMRLGGHFLRLLEPRLTQGPKPTLDEADRQAVRDRFRESNEFIRRRFFPERETLFPSEEPTEPRSEPDAEALYELAADLLAELWKAHAELVLNRRRGSAGTAGQALPSEREV